MQQQRHQLCRLLALRLPTQILRRPQRQLERLPERLPASQGARWQRGFHGLHQRRRVPGGMHPEPLQR
jgi:hypothetical protein